MKTLLKKVCVYFIAVAIVIGYMPITGNVSHVEAASYPITGQCGDNLEWSLDRYGTLTLTGSGDMYDYAEGKAPWYEYYRDILYLKFVSTGSPISIGTYAFYGCSNISTASFDNVTAVDAYAFSDCYGMKWIYMSNYSLSKLTISGYAFNECYKLTTVYCPQSTVIEANAFSMCDDLKKVEINSGSATGAGNPTIADSAFESWEDIVVCGTPNAIPTEWLSQDKSSWASATMLSRGRDVTCEHITSGTYGSGIAWYYYEDTATLKILGSGSLPVCASGTQAPWYSYKDYIENIEITGIQTIPAYSFESLKKVKSITISDDLKELACNAFNNHQKLTDLFIPASVESFTEGTFFNGYDLKSIYYPGTEEDWNNIDNATDADQGHIEIHCLVLNEDTATCTEEGLTAHYTFGENSVYDYYYDLEKNKIDAPAVSGATGHAWEEDYTVDKEATCTEEGSKSIHCAACDEVKVVTVIDKLAHTYGEWIIDKEASCTEAGSKHKTCSCGDTVTEEIAALGHDHSEEWAVDEEPTCTTAGSKSHHCTRCDAKADVTTIEKLSHTYGDWIIDKEPTCTEAGVKHKTCSCGDTITSEITVADHTWNKDYTIEQEATCITAGSKCIRCSACDVIKENSAVEIPKLAKASGWYEEADTWYYFSNYDLVKGWKQLSKKWYCFDSDGKMLTGLQDIDGKKYAFNASGAMLTGWQKISEEWYYFSGGGAALKGWQQLSKKWYYFDEDCKMYEKEWLNDKYYFKSGGAMVTGWQLIDGEDYHFNASGIKTTNKWVGAYYLKANGKMAKNEWVGNYYVGANGAYQKGWLKLDEGWYYLGTNGVKKTGWFKVKTTWYYGDKSTGLLYEEKWLDDKYYFKSGGAMVTGWQVIDGEDYHFNASGVKTTSEWIGNYYLKEDGKMARSEWIENYYVGENGAWIKGYPKVS